jgi:hypothetical protein
MRSRRFPALGRSATELSVTDSYLCRSGDEFNMRFRVPQWLVNIAHFSKLSGGRETAPARGELRPSSEGSPFVDGDPCRTKTPSGHSFHSEIRTACHEKYFSCRISVPEVEHAWQKRNFLLRHNGRNLHRLACDIHAPLFWESEPPPTFAHMPLPKSSRARLSPSICVISRLRVGLTIPMYPKCSRCMVQTGTVAPKH